MKALLFKNPKSESQSFHSQEDIGKHFYDHLHYHPEIQLTLILESSGTLFAGDKIDRFNKGDIYLLGGNLPHVFRNDSKYYQTNSELKAHGISVHFSKNCFGESFFNSPELSDVNRLIVQSERGIKLSPLNLDIFINLFQKIHQEKGINRFIHLLQLLEQINEHEEINYLSSIAYSNPEKEKHNHRINTAFEYVMKNFHDKIELAEVARLTFMTPASFSRFFKQRTRKTFSRFVNEVRCAEASKLLMEEKISISEIAFRCGFNNLSNFNRQYKKITSYTPGEYKSAHR